MKIPLANQLRKRVHLETASLQDEVIEVVYSLGDCAVLHGGTAVWRCYDGNRFSEDLDFYFAAPQGFESEFGQKLAQRQLELVKFKQTDNAIYSKISDGTVEVRFEALLKNYSKQGDAEVVTRSFKRVDGSFLDVLTLSAEALLLEKAETFSSRRLVRDYYDVYHLLRYVEQTPRLKKALEKLLGQNAEPLDTQNLQALVYIGAVPSFSQMRQAIQRFSQ